MEKEKEQSKKDQPYESREQKESRYRLMNLFAKMQLWAQRALGAKARKETLEKFLETMKKAHVSFSVYDKQRDLDFTILLLVIVCVYGIDVLLFKATAEYHAGRAFSSEWVLALASVLGPAMILILEIGVGVQRHLASVDKDLNGSSGFWGWTIVGAFLATVMPMLAIATTYVALPDLEGPVKTAFILQNVGLAILGLVSHILVLFSGRYGHEAKGYFPYRVNMFLGKFKLSRAEKEYIRSANKAASIYEVYRTERGLHQYRYPNPPMQTILLDHASQTILNEQFGGALSKDILQNKPASKNAKGGYTNIPHMEEDLMHPVSSDQRHPMKDKNNSAEEAGEARLMEVHRADQEREWPS